MIVVNGFSNHIKRIVQKCRNKLSLSSSNVPSFEDKLTDKIVELTTLDQMKCSSALSYILRALDYNPQNKIVKELAYRLLMPCLRPYHRCNEPITQEQINDQRLDDLFNECSICRVTWIPITPELLGYDKNVFVVGASSTGYGGYCTKCNKAFCCNHVKNPIPTHDIEINSHCPNCGNELNIRDAFGRKSNQSPRLNKILYHVVLIREGFIPPDKEYCKKVFKNSSTDVFEDFPDVTSIALSPWEYDAESVLENVHDRIVTHKKDKKWNEDYQAIIWPGFDLDTNTHLYIVKIWTSKPRVTLENIYTIPECREDFSFETAELSEHPQGSTDLSGIKIIIPKITKKHLDIKLIDSKLLEKAGPGEKSFQMAIQSLNAEEYDDGKYYFEDAINKGLDPLRQGYVYAELGNLKLLKYNDLNGAIEQYIKIFTFKEALYESIIHVSQYLDVILSEIGRLEDAALIRQLSFKAQAHLGYSLNPVVADKVKDLVRKKIR